MKGSVNDDSSSSPPGVESCLTISCNGSTENSSGILTMTSGGFSSSKDGISPRNSSPIHDSGNLTNQLEKLDLNQSRGNCLIYILYELKAM